MIDYKSPVQQPMPQQKVVKQVEQPVANHPEEPFLGLEPYMWTGVIVPIVIAWIINRKMKK